MASLLTSMNSGENFRVSPNKLCYTYEKRDILPSNNLRVGITIRQLFFKLLVFGLMTLRFLALSFCLIQTILLSAQFGTIDYSFGDSGIVIKPVGLLNDFTRDMVIQKDHKIIIGGITNDGLDNDVFLMRFHADGSPDNGFGNNGTVKIIQDTTIESLIALELQDDGKLVALRYYNSGGWQFGICRFLTDGSLDKTFGINGYSLSYQCGDVSYIADMSTTDDGKFIVGGRDGSWSNTDYVVVRYLSNGAPDSSFGTNGKSVITTGTTSENCYKVLPLKNGQLLMLGASNSQLAVLRVNSNGTLDKSFGNNGLASYVVPGGAELIDGLIQTDGKILGVGYTKETKSQMLAIRLNSDGTLDGSFDGDGIKLIKLGRQHNSFSAVTTQSDGRILILGQTADTVTNSNTALVMLHYDGSMDSSFGIKGVTITDIAGDHEMGKKVRLVENNKILIAGDVQKDQLSIPMIIRYNPGANSGMHKFPVEKTNYTLFPNPCHDKIFLNCKSNSLLSTSIYISDINGKEINGPCIFPTSQNVFGDIVVDTKYLNPGTYVLSTFSHSGKRESSLFVKE